VEVARLGLPSVLRFAKTRVLVHLDEVFWKSGGFSEKRLLSEVAACFAEQERPQIAIGLLEAPRLSIPYAPWRSSRRNVPQAQAAGASHRALNATRSCASDDAVVRAGR
jgi:hypothetical protein